MAGSSFRRAPQQIELQLLRHGETYNQLLSPLTDYMAICGDHPTATVNIPLKHQALLTRLRALDYKDTSETRDDQLDELSSVVSQIFAEFPGLSTELSRCVDCLAHVSLATSAAELAMVPFELAMMPPGTAGATQRMCLQPHIPVCLTRRSRNVDRPKVDWNRQYRILMIASDAGGEIPVVEHYALLRKLIDPWIDLTRHDSGRNEADSVREGLVLITNPTERSIRELLKQEKFTHVHVLAHGAATNSTETQFGLALHSSESATGIDVVDGERLGGLFGYRPDQPDHSPLVVTLAVCQSGRQNNVLIPSSSLAFAIHNKGVPVVVGSQFPLSVGGSIVMTGELYEGLLNGLDPRYVIWRTRSALYTAAENVMEHVNNGIKFSTAMHDWASMTVYAEFPGTFNDIIPDAERSRIVSRLKPKMAFLDSTARRLQVLESGSNGTTARDSNDSRSPAVGKDLLDWSVLQKPRDEINRLREWIENHQWKDLNGRRRASSKGILASAQKRLGLVFLQIAAHGRTPNSNEDEAVGLAVKQLFENLKRQNVPFLEGVEIDSPETLVSVLDRIGVQLLKDAKLSYDEVFRLSRSEGWALVQSLSLSLAVSYELPQQRFETAWLLNDIDLGHPESLRRTWALAARTELILQALVYRDLSLAGGIQTFVPPERDLKQEFREALIDLARMAWQEPNEVRSTLLQLRRFDTDLIELVAMKSQSLISRTRTSSSGALVSPASGPEGREFSNPNSMQYRTAQRRQLKSKISQEHSPEPSKKSRSDDRQRFWNCIRELSTFVRRLIEPMFDELDIQSYR